MKNITKKFPLNGTFKRNKRKAKKKEHDPNKGLRKLFIDEIQDIYKVEKALTKAFPKMIKNATAVLLVEALIGHLEATQKHVTKLEGAFPFTGEKSESKKCKAMSYLIKDARSIMKGTEDGKVRDAAIISAVQKIEHYEIATYGTLCSFANALGETEASLLLHEILIEEKAVNERLSELAELGINAEAVADNLSVSEQKQLA